MSDRRALREGVVVGLIAYAAVAGFYMLFDLLAARGALYTLNLLGQSGFRGLRDPGVLQVPLASDATAMLLYNAVHLLSSLAIGMVVTWLVYRAERHPDQAGLTGLLLIMGGVITVLGIGFLTTPLRPLLPFWSILVANLLAVVLAGRYLIRQHPTSWRRLLPLGAG